MKPGPKPRPPAEAAARRRSSCAAAMRRMRKRQAHRRWKKLRTTTARKLLPDLQLKTCWKDLVREGLSISRKQHAACYYLDVNGKLHRSDTRSAAQVIRDWEEEQKKERKRSP